MSWIVWQIADSAFPMGGFAHSSGLEAACQQGEVEGVAGLQAFLRAALHQAGHGSLPLVGRAFDDPAELAALDALCDAFLSSRVANRASRTQGRALLSACERALPLSSIRAIGDAARRPSTGLRAGQMVGPHFAPVFGALMRALGLERSATLALFLYITARGVLAAAVRLGVIGPYQAQHLQFELTPELERIFAECEHLTTSDLAQTAPLLDLWQSTHDRLYSRLFQS